MGANDVQAAEDRGSAVRLTVVGLFDDHIDAEHALLALQRAARLPEQVSLIVRDRSADEGHVGERGGEVARALVASALDTVGGWLKGLASLIVSERGTYLVAGPMGAALAARGAGTEEQSPPEDEATSYTSAGLRRTLTDFGVSADEAEYLEHRVAAGAALIAVTSGDAEQAQATQAIFADHSAVYIGVAQTDERLVREATAALGTVPATHGHSDIVVTDAVAPLVHLCASNGAGAHPLCGKHVVDRDGLPAGVITDVLADPDARDEHGQPVIRYIVLAHGGVLGLGRHHAAVPANCVDLTKDPVELNFQRVVLADAPVLEAGGAFSRREELAVLAYFGSEPYWQTDEAAVR